MSAETAVSSSLINNFNLLRPWDSKAEKHTHPGSANSLLTPASLPGILSPMLMPHLTSLTQGTSAARAAVASPASTASALLSQVPLRSPAISIPVAAAAVTSHQPQHQALSQRPTATSQTSFSFLPPPTSAGISSPTCSNLTALTTLSQSEDKVSKHREHRRRDHHHLPKSSTEIFLDTILSNYHEQERMSRNFNFMQNLMSPILPYQSLPQNSKHAPFRSPMNVVIRCSAAKCFCDCFVPGKPLMRVCGSCNHGFIAHAMEKHNFDKFLNFSKYGSPTLAGQNIPGFQNGNSRFDIASLMLFGTHALPVRLKILLDRMLCTLEHEELVKLLLAFGWTYEDYSRGYILQDALGNILTDWTILSKEEEMYIIRMFLKYDETKTIAHQFMISDPMTSQFSDNSAILTNNKLTDYELKKLVDCTNASFLPKNSLLNANSHKSPISELNTHNSKNNFENKANKASNHYGERTREGEEKLSRSLAKSEETEKAQSTAKQTSKAQVSPVNHLVSTSPKSEAKANKEKSMPNNANVLSTFNTLSKLENLMPPFDFRKKEGSKNLHDSPPDANQFLAVSSANSVANPLFSLGGFNSLLNPALLGDPSKFPNAADLCKIDLSNPAAVAAVAAAAGLNKSLDFSSFKSESGPMSNAGSNNCQSASDAINLTHSSKHSSSNHHHHNHHHEKKSSSGSSNNNKHMRKSSNPIKRRWDPLVLSGLNTNPSTGKKRVQCTVCFKTFCDKGALKIHFSAVHLREMHKCTVDGCNMMFSSRRSRNRHSANPNPKLHTPNFRRKINPHDGRTANPYPLIQEAANTLFGMSPVNGGLLSNFDPLKGNYSSEHSPKDDYALDFNSMSSHSSRATPNEELLDDTYSDENSCKEDMDDDNGDVDICIDLSVKDDTHKSPRKRKNFNPIKFSSNNGNCHNELDHEQENENNSERQHYQYLSTDDDDEDDDDDDMSSDAEYSVKGARHANDEFDSDAAKSSKLGPNEDNNTEADTDVDIDEPENGKLDHSDVRHSRRGLEEQEAAESSAPTNDS